MMSLFVRWNFVNLRYGHIVEGVCGDAWQYWKWLPFSVLCLKIITLILTTHNTTQHNHRQDLWICIVQWLVCLITFSGIFFGWLHYCCLCTRVYTWTLGRAFAIGSGGRQGRPIDTRLKLLLCTVYWSLCFHEFLPLDITWCYQNTHWFSSAAFARGKLSAYRVC